MDHGKRRHNVVAEVLGDLFKGEFQAGQRLRVEFLAERYGVSVTPIREALVELSGLGLVELQPNRGAVVRPFGPRQVLDICHLRRVLECEATRNACGRIAPFELAALEDELKKLIDAPRGQRGQRWLAETKRLDTALHELIAERCGSERLAYEISRYSVLYRILRDAQHRRRTARANYSQMEENSEHLKVVQALAAGDAERASDAMADHVDKAAAALQHDLFAKKEIEADLAESFLESPRATMATVTE
ncbi:MAG: GntR family transcriptional regulator [Fuerstiella sp.]|nr:GntR family transcriptional regulator [Fuerstiella sp.]